MKIFLVLLACSIKAEVSHYHQDGLSANGDNHHFDYRPRKKLYFKHYKTGLYMTMTDLEGRKVPMLKEKTSKDDQMFWVTETSWGK